MMSMWFQPTSGGDWSCCCMACPSVAILTLEGTRSKCAEPRPSCGHLLTLGDRWHHAFARPITYEFKITVTHIENFSWRSAFRAYFILTTQTCPHESTQLNELICQVFSTGIWKIYLITWRALGFNGRPLTGISSLYWGCTVACFHFSNCWLQGLPSRRLLRITGLYLPLPIISRPSYPQGGFYLFIYLYSGGLESTRGSRTVLANKSGCEGTAELKPAHRAIFRRTWPQKKADLICSVTGV